MSNKIFGENCFLKSLYNQLINIDNEIYETILEKLYSIYIDKGSIAIDIGAHIGRHTFPMAKAVGEEGKVIAFEPLPSLYEKINAKIVENKLQNVVELHQVALSNTKGEVEFLYIADEPGLSGLKYRTSHDGHKINYISVTVKELDSVITEKQKISFIKIDAEGADFFILKGSKRILKNDRPLIVFESGRINSFPAASYGYSEDEFNEFFQTESYVLYDIAGIKYNPYFWNYQSLNDFVAMPLEHEEEYRQILIISVLSVLGNYAVHNK